MRSVVPPSRSVVVGVLILIIEWIRLLRQPPLLRLYNAGSPGTLYVLAKPHFQVKWTPNCLVGSDLSQSCCTSSSQALTSIERCSAFAAPIACFSAKLSTYNWAESFPSGIFFQQFSRKAPLRDVQSSSVIVSLTRGLCTTCRFGAVSPTSPLACFHAETKRGISRLCEKLPAGVRSTPKMRCLETYFAVVQSHQCLTVFNLVHPVGL